MTGAPPRPTPPVDASPREVVLWVVRVVNAHDAEALRPVLADDCRHRLPGRTHRGADAVVASVAALVAAVPDATLTALAVAAEDETVFVRWRLTGTHTGAPWDGLEAGGARIDVDGVDQVTVHDQRITSSFAIFDQLQLGHQMRLLPTPGSRVDIGLRYAVNALTRMRGGA